MADLTSGNNGLNLSSIQDPSLRRALRSIHDQMAATMSRQQLQIDALIEVALDKHLTSMGEFRRQLSRLQQEHTRGQRLHDALGTGLGAAPSPPSVAPAEVTAALGEEDLPRRIVLRM